MGMAEPSLMIVSGARLILPNGKPPSRAWPELAFAMLMEPEPDELTVWLGRLEHTLGVTDEMRTAMAGRAVSAVTTSEQKRRRLLEQSQRAARLNAPMRDPSLVRLMGVKRRAAAAHLAHAQRLKVAAKGKDRKLIRRLERKARTLLEAAEQARVTELDHDRLYGEAKETILLARSRGEEVLAYEAETASIARDEHGARILHKRGSHKGLPVLAYDRGLRANRLTGPEQASASGHLAGGPLAAEVLLRVAAEYREAYLYGEGQVSGTGEGGGGFGPKAPQPKRAEQSQALADMRRLLADRLRKVLDLVCGQDMRICEARRAIGDGDDRTTARALRIGLDAARRGRMAAVMARKENGTSGELAARIAAGNELLAQVRG